MVPTTERRARDNRALESIINVGIAYKHALGPDVALAFYKREAVAPAIVARVLAAAAPRRRAPADILVADHHGASDEGDADACPR